MRQKAPIVSEPSAANAAKEEKEVIAIAVGTTEEGTIGTGVTIEAAPSINPAPAAWLVIFLGRKIIFS